jgi:uncharacterized protein YndB with AHSA1/START domain
MMEKPTYIAMPGSLEMVITHKFEAPRELVYKIYTDPSLIPEWWGPRDLTTIIERMELRPGGIWRYIQHDAQNNEFAFHGVYHSLELNKQIISTFEWEGMPGHVILETTRFDEQRNRTIVTQQDVFQTVQDRDGMIQQGMEQGIIEGDERFNELLARFNFGQKAEKKIEQHSENTGCITITRDINAPRERVWDLWTDSNQYRCWWGPKDFSSPYARLDLRVGGKYLSCMRGPDGKEYWDTGIYEEISAPSRIVYTDTFADQNGNVVPASYYGLGSDEPMEMAVEVRLEDIGGRTRMVVEQCGLPEGEMLDQARVGWSQSFDKLANCLG